MTDFEAKAIALLTSIDASMKQLVAAANRRSAAANGGVPAVAADNDLDGKYGDEKVRFSPRDWHGESMKGCRMSECPPDFLDLLAQSFDFFAKKNDEKGEKDSQGRPKSTYDRRSASRARGWALRLRGGWKPEPQEETDLDGEDPDFDSDNGGF